MKLPQPVRAVWVGRLGVGFGVMGNLGREKKLLGPWQRMIGVKAKTGRSPERAGLVLGGVETRQPGAATGRARKGGAKSPG